MLEIAGGILLALFFVYLILILIGIVNEIITTICDILCGLIDWLFGGEE